MQLFPSIAPINPLTIWLPLGLATCITALFALFDDVKRYVNDIKINNRERVVWREKKEKKVKAKDIYVGEIVKVYENQEIPCDLVLIKSSNDDNICYIQTSNLDGEIDLKIRCIPTYLIDYYDNSLKNNETEIVLNELKGKIMCINPNSDVNSFNGSLKIDNYSTDIPLSKNNLLLQSCILKNTKYVYGICVYNGNYTKYGMNKRKIPTKTSKCEGFLDRLTLFIFIFQIIFSIVFGVWATLSYKPLFYLEGDKGSYWYYWIIVFLRYLSLSSYIVPISMKTIKDILKVLYSLLIRYDIDMYDEESDQPASCRNFNIIEDLGQIDHICTDKTGTLTMNILKLKEVSIGKEIYDVYDDSSKVKEVILNSYINNGKEIMFFKALSLCHACTIDDNEQYKSASLDEETLVETTKLLGVVLTEVKLKSYTISCNGSKEKYEILKILEFTSDRKRMSVLLKNMESNSILLFIKGADEVIINRIEFQEKGGEDAKNTLKQNLNDFSDRGLRTLVICYRELTQEFTSDWLKRLNDVENIVDESRQEEINKLYKEIESGLTVLGVTAIEDKLQESVPETIKKLQTAKIKVWMLTGDKTETAINIAHSCNLLTINYPVYLLDEDEKAFENEGDYIKKMKENCKQITKTIAESKKDGYYIVVNGKTLKSIFNCCIEEYKSLLMKASSVVCSRVIPIQKGEIVKFLQKQNLLVCSVGDGGNDIPMIQTSNIGIGIIGKEGFQASKTADFAIKQFKFLIPLIFVHGQYDCIRHGLFVQYQMSRNISIAFIHMFYNTLTRLSGISPFNDISLQFFNVLAFQLFVVLDRFLDKKILKERTELYEFSKKRKTFSILSFSFWFVKGVFNGIVVLLILYFTYDGINISTQYFGILLMTSLTYILDLEFLIFSYSYNVVTISIIIFLILFYHVFLIIYNVILSLFLSIGDIPFITGIVKSFFGDYSNIYFVVFKQYTDTNAYFSVLLSTVICVLVSLLFKYFKMKYYPNIIDKFLIRNSMLKRDRLNKKQIELSENSVLPTSSIDEEDK